MGTAGGMRNPKGKFGGHAGCTFVCCAALALLSSSTVGQVLQLKVDPQPSTVKFTLGDVLHTVHGSFQLTRGDIRFDPATNKLSGEIVVDAKSGETGNGMRDRKMHKEVLESERYSEIVFHPGNVEGNVALQGTSSVRVHGVLSIHGADHEITVPAEINVFPNRWTANLHLSLPYVSWGMKNPSTLFLRVSESVEVEVMASGAVIRP
jgi:polyisoprenoid-binding protein YceI